MGMKISVRNLKRVIKETLEEMNAAPTASAPEDVLRGILDVPRVVQYLASVHQLPVDRMLRYMGDDVHGQGFDEAVLDTLQVRKDTTGQWTLTDPDSTFMYVWDGASWNEA